MKDFFISQCADHENKNITASFVVASKQIKPKKSGEPYLALTLTDRTGTIEAKMWDGVPEAMGTFEQDDIIKVRGLINKYNSRFQLTIHKVRRMDDSEVDYSDYLPKTSKDVDVLWKTLGDFVGSFKDDDLRALVQSFMADPEIERAYKNAPAAKTLHHAFIGGLLDHVVSLFTACDLICRNYPSINRDLVLTGAFLHDIGKIHELTYARSFGYSTSGQLLGHMIIELEMLHQKLAALPDFPPQMKILIEHMIISHHGQYEFGSPKLPMFPEALLLHYMDDLDSKMEAMRAQFERDLSDSDWTQYNPSLGRPLLNTAKFLAVKPTAPVPMPDHAAKGEVSNAEVPKAEAAAAAADSGAIAENTKSEVVAAATERSLDELRRKFVK